MVRRIRCYSVKVSYAIIVSAYTVYVEIFKWEKFRIFRRFRRFRR